jgi:hypothetical protein
VKRLIAQTHIEVADDRARYAHSPAAIERSGRLIETLERVQAQLRERLTAYGD